MSADTAITILNIFAIRPQVCLWSKPIKPKYDLVVKDVRTKMSLVVSVENTGNRELIVGFLDPGSRSSHVLPFWFPHVRLKVLF